MVCSYYFAGQIQVDGNILPFWEENEENWAIFQSLVLLKHGDASKWGHSVKNSM